MLLSLFAMVYVLIFVRDSIRIRETRLHRERSERGEESKPFERQQTTVVQKLK